MDAWAPGIRLLASGIILSKPEPRLGTFQLMRYFPFLDRILLIVHYRLGESAE